MTLGAALLLPHNGTAANVMGLNRSAVERISDLGFDARYACQRRVAFFERLSVSGDPAWRMRVLFFIVPR
jgi:hypothetical protein